MRGTDTTRLVEFHGPWEYTMETSLAEGYHKLVKQKLVDYGRLQTWVMVKEPDSDTARLDHGVYRIEPDEIRGGGTEVGHVDIHRLDHGLYVSVARYQFPERRERRLQQQTPLRLRVYDVHEPECRHPLIIIAADDTETMTRTVGMIVCELTSLMVDPRFLVWAPVENDWTDSTLSHSPVAQGA